MGKDNQHPHIMQQANLRQALVAGALAGVAVDSVLYPLGKAGSIVWSDLKVF